MVGLIITLLRIEHTGSGSIGRSWHIGLKKMYLKSPLACSLACTFWTFAPLFGYTWPLFKISKMGGTMA